MAKIIVNDINRSHSEVGITAGLLLARQVVKDLFPCQCDTAYTSRGRHESNAWHLCVSECVLRINDQLKEFGVIVTEE